ncbi:MAG: hypothetical protein ACXQTE_06060 [Methanosarcinaceae archaeon]
MNHIRGLLLVITIMLWIGCASATTITDPTGDFYFPDIKELSVDIENGDLEIIITCTDSLIGEDISGAVFIDTDQDHTTAYARGTGADYVYQYSVISIIYSDPIRSVTLNDDMIDENTLYIENDRMIITIPLSMLGNDDGNMDVFVTTHTQLVKALDFDRAPDFGVLNTVDGSVQEQFPTDIGGVTLTDPAGDAGIADMRLLDAKVENGRLEIEITYSNNVEPEYLSYGDDNNGWIYLDTDQKLATGFTNTEQAPPTFGVDHMIEYTIGNVLGTDASIRTIDTDSDLTLTGYTQTTGISIGVPYNDASFRVNGNKVYLDIPLGLLGYDEGNMDIVVDSFTVGGLMNSEIDRIPEQGALDTGIGSIKNLHSCVYQKVIMSDPAGDSLGFGVDGDDITSFDACYSGSTLLLTVGYTELELDDGAITTISFDTDQNGHSERMLVYALYNGKLGANIFGEYEGRYGVREATHLITMKGNKMYISIPMEFLGNDDGSMNMNVETALISTKAEISLTQQSRKWISSEGLKFGTGEVYINPDKFNRMIYDRLPDTGTFSIGQGIEQQPTPTTAAPPPKAEGTQEVPGFEAIFMVVGILGTALFCKKKI